MGTAEPALCTQAVYYFGSSCLTELWHQRVQGYAKVSLTVYPSGWWELCSWIIWKTRLFPRGNELPFVSEQSAFCVIWVMEMFSRNEKMFAIWWFCASFLVLTRGSSMTSNCIWSQGLKGCVKYPEYAWCVSLFMHPWLSPSLSSVPAVRTYL